MDVKDYCKNVETELTAWKAKMYDLSRKLDKVPTGDKEKVVPHIEDLHQLIAQMEDRIDRLEKECPTEWEPEKQEIEGAHVDLRSKFDEAVNAIGKATPYSVPG
ncbi:MAG: hypothetical protein ACLFOY_08085 [Desulfatibacillaceae bacterium]